MREQRNKISFRGQKIYVGIDVHLKSWSVTVLSETSVLKKFSQHPSPRSVVRIFNSEFIRAPSITRCTKRASADFGYTSV